MNIAGGLEPAHVHLAQVSANFPALLGTTPLVGRSFSPEEDSPGASAVALISSRLWQRPFNSDPQVLKRPLLINGAKWTVIGVMPPGFNFPAGVDIWTPTIHSETQLSQWGAVANFMLARMKPGVTPAQVSAQQKGLFGKVYPDLNRDSFIGLNGVRWMQPPIAQSLQQQLFASQNKSVLLLAGAVSLVLFIACVNIANFVLARTVTRSQEFAIRRALGVSRPRLIRQVLTEQILLGLLGGVMGIALAYASLPALRLLLPVDWPSFAVLALNWKVLLVAFLLSFATGVFTAAAPSLRFFRKENNIGLPQGDRVSESPRQRRWRYLLVTAETVLATVLLSSTGTLVQRLVELTGVNPGFQPSHVLTVSVTRPDARDGKSAAASAFYNDALQSLRALPGVKMVGAVNDLPIRSKFVMVIEAKAENSRKGEQASPKTVTPHYFSAMGIPLLSGRDFNESDESGKPDVAIVTESLARKLWPDGNALEQRFYIDAGKPLRVVGVVGSVRFFGPGTDPLSEIYRPSSQQIPDALTFVLRVYSRPESYETAVRNVIHKISPLQPIDEIGTMEDYWSRSMSGPRSLAMLASIFTLLGVLLTLIGIYAVVSYSVACRAREFSIRLVLGAQPRALLTNSVLGAISWVLPGVLLGVASAFTLQNYIESQIPGARSRQPELVMALGFALLIISALAGLVAAWRSATFDPARTLRTE